MYKGARKMKYYNEGKTVRLTWSWPAGVDTVDVCENDAPGKLYTLQEYKQRGGYVLPKKPGRFTYHIGENEISFTHQTEIALQIREKNFPWQKLKNFEIICTAEHDVPPDIVCYEINSTEYSLGEPLTAKNPLTRIISAEKNESVRFFITEENSELYTLQN